MRRHALSLPEAFEDHPWDHIAVKVRKKAFVFLSGKMLHEGKLSMTVKLPRTGEMTLTLPFMERAGPSKFRARAREGCSNLMAQGVFFDQPDST